MITLRTTLAVLLTFSTSLIASAQIQITESDVSGFFNNQVVSRYVADDFSLFEALIDQTGPGRTFDFTLGDYTLESSYSVEPIVCSAVVAGCDDPHLADANLIVRTEAADSSYVMFNSINSSGMTILGSAFRMAVSEEDREDLEDLGVDPNIDSLTYVNRFEPGLLELALPLSMGRQWQSSSAMTIILVEAELELDELPMTLTRSSTVDGWGELITPHGSAQALRYRTQNVTSASFMGFEFSDTTYTITFLAANGMQAEIFIESDGEVGEVAYSRITASVSNESRIELPTTARLHQNYPNPFNPTTTIAFELEQSGPVRLAVYDMLGREVGVLLDGNVQPGRHEVVWDAAHEPSGSYLIRLETDRGTYSRTTVLLK